MKADGTAAPGGAEAGGAELAFVPAVELRRHLVPQLLPPGPGMVRCR